MYRIRWFNMFVYIGHMGLPSIRKAIDFLRDEMYFSYGANILMLNITSFAEDKCETIKSLRAKILLRFLRLVYMKDPSYQEPGQQKHIWWRHQMETSSALNSPHKGQWRRAFMFLWSASWINGWVSNRGALIWDAIALIVTSLQWQRSGNILKRTGRGFHLTKS